MSPGNRVHGRAIAPERAILSSMYNDWLANGMVIVATMAAVCGSVLLHYEGLLFTSRRLPPLGVVHRAKVLYGIASVLFLHVLEIWIFGLTLWLLLQWPACGSLGPQAQHLLDIIYFSAVTFTTVGFGDLAPIGPIRFLSGTEALTGFVLITWSASFTYLGMERFWRNP
jgi:Ion channel